MARKESLPRIPQGEAEGVVRMEPCLESPRQGLGVWSGVETLTLSDGLRYWRWIYLASLRAWVLSQQ